MATTVLNQFVPLQFARDLINSFAPHAQHVRHEVLRQSNLVCPDPIVGHQQPAREPRVQGVESIAG
jgi:hypothetical protein